MRDRHPVALLRRIGVGQLALRHRRLRIGVEGDRHRRVRELHRGDVHQVAPHRQLLALALDHVDRVARRVAVGRVRAHARHQLGLAAERLEPARVLVGLERRDRGGEEVLVPGRRLGGVVQVQPVVGVVLVHPHHRVREQRLAVLAQPGRMVGMQVGDVDLVDLLGLVARRLQVGEQLAGGRTEGAIGAGVDQHQLGAGVDQVAIDRGLHRRLQELLVQRLHDAAGLGLVHQLVHRQVDGAVAEGGDFEIAQHQAVVARRLGLHLRGRRLHARRGQRERETEGGELSGTGHEEPPVLVMSCREARPARLGDVLRSSRRAA